MKPTELNTSVCGNEKNIFDSEGRYIKTACAVFSPTRHSEACINHGMNLITIGSTKIRKEILKFASNMFGGFGGSTLWVNGRKSFDGKWFKHKGDKKFLIQNLKAITRNLANSTGNSISDKKFLFNSTLDENCLSINAMKNFMVRPWICNDFLFGICEYIKADVPQRLQPKLEICNKTTHVHSRVKYFKSLCLIKNNLTFSDAEDLCEENGMKIFAQNKTMTENQIAFKKILIGHETAEMWIGGNQPELLTVNDDTLEFYEGCKFLSYDKFNKKLLSIRKKKCSNMIWGVCEYNKNFR